MKFEEVGRKFESKEYRKEERGKMQEIIFRTYRYYTGEVIIS